jgi:hypothetical protein
MTVYSCGILRCRIIEHIYVLKSIQIPTLNMEKVVAGDHEKYREALLCGRV